jgi:hypothetical protein
MMRVSHYFSANGTCPVNAQKDEYQIVVSLHGDCYDSEPVTTVEQIRAACDDLLSTPIFQEDFTRALAGRFLAHVVTLCRHEGGFLTICEARG